MVGTIPCVLDGLRRWVAGLLRTERKAGPLEGLETEGLRLVVGLGNPGPEYEATRHNVGFRLCDRLTERVHGVWTRGPGETNSLVAVGPYAAGTLVLAKPQTYMNNSGRAVRALAAILQIPPHAILVAYDDMDLPLGSLRLRERGSAGTHNGMRSVVSALGTSDVPRLRIGISQVQGADARGYVLDAFGNEEQEVMQSMLQRSGEAVLTWAEMGAPAAMNRFNG